MPTSRTSAQVYRAFADGKAFGTLYAPVALALSRSGAALSALDTVPAGRRHPRIVLAALHDLALAGRAPTLAAAYAAGDGAAAGVAAVDTVVRDIEGLVRTATRARLHTDPTGHPAVLYPAIAQAAHRRGASAVGLVDVAGAGLNLVVDRVGVTYGIGHVVGDRTSAVQASASVVGENSVPTRAMPEVLTRILLDDDPVDVTDAADVRWLRACLRPDQAEQRARLDAELALAATIAPLGLPGPFEESLPEALARVPASALPVVITTWALSGFPVDRRLRFRQRLEEAGRAVAWVSVEGVGVAPGMPTLGDRPASGHSLVGLAVVDGRTVHAEVLGRCWSRGRLLSWLAAP